jgi:hypothetical protein
VPSSPTNFIVSLPLPGNLKSVARYWSPKAWRPTMIGFVQPGTRRGTFLQMIGSRKITPPRMLRIVPLGERYMRFRPNSSTRASSGVIVAHFTPTPCFLMALAASMVIWSSVSSRFSIAEVVIFQVDIEIGVDQLVLDELPDDAGHLIAVELDDRICNLDLCHALR